MKEKEAVALLGLLFLKSGNTFCSLPAKDGMEDNIFPNIDEVDPLWLTDVLGYLRSLKIPFKLAYDILNGVYYNFYHAEMGHNSDWLPKHYKKKNLYPSEFDYIEIDEYGRVGIWCEVDGFIAWLDEYKTVWVVDSKLQLWKNKRREKKIAKELRERMLEMCKNCEWELPDESMIEGEYPFTFYCGTASVIDLYPEDIEEDK